MAAEFTLRDARRDDAATLIRLIKALEVYEKLEREAIATPELLEAALFNDPPRAHAMIAEIGNRAVGFAI